MIGIGSAHWNMTAVQPWIIEINNTLAVWILIIHEIGAARIKLNNVNADWMGRSSGAICELPSPICISLNCLMPQVARQGTPPTEDIVHVQKWTTSMQDIKSHNGHPDRMTWTFTSSHIRNRNSKKYNTSVTFNFYVRDVRAPRSSSFSTFIW